MRFEFASVAELDEFLIFCSRIHQSKPVTVNVHLDEHGDEPLPEIDEAPEISEIVEMTPNQSLAHREAQDAKNAAYIAETVKQNAVESQRRKRRTKAEMEAARAAEQAGNASPAGEATTDGASTNSPESATEAAGAGNPFAQPMPTGNEPIQNAAPEDVPDVIQFIKSRLGERPEVSQVDHLNMARTFIGKHGMDKYNQSFALAGLTNNAMGYSVADCATHAAALDFLSLE